jgi:hypothetical protein
MALGVLLLAAVAAAQDVSVTTKDGATVEGKLASGDLKIKTDFGSATVDADKIVLVRFGEPDVIVTQGDFELRGEIRLSSLRIKTESGTKTIRRADLVELAVMQEGRPRGVAKLEQSGLGVAGTYGEGRRRPVQDRRQGQGQALLLHQLLGPRLGHPRDPAPEPGARRRGARGDQGAAPDLEDVRRRLQPRRVPRVVLRA